MRRFTLNLCHLARRYLPAEIMGTVVMFAACMLVARWDDRLITMVLTAIIAESAGFYGVVGWIITAEQWRATAGLDRRARRTTVRTAGLMAVEFGPAEVVDTLTRAPVLALSISLVGPGWLGLGGGKVGADLIFYAFAASAYNVTRVQGWRTPRLDPALHPPVIGEAQDATIVAPEVS